MSELPENQTIQSELGSVLQALMQNASNNLGDVISKSQDVIAAANPPLFNVLRPTVKVSITDQTSAMGALEKARQYFSQHRYPDAIDIYEQLTQALPAHETELLAELYDQYQKMPQNRYSLYVSRSFDFKISAHDKVLDIGSGHDPFPLATHLADLAPDDDSFGRAGIPIKYIEGKPFFACGVEDMPFADKEFDFVYCSHVLEHVDNPERACKELMRIAKRGYLETPNIGKDIWLNTAKISNHHWYVENIANQLIFTRYPKHLLEGIGSNLLMDMHCRPQTIREKAFSALVLLKSPVINTAMYWENEIRCVVRSS